MVQVLFRTGGARPRLAGLAAVALVAASGATVAVLSAPSASAAATSVQVYWSSESRTAGYTGGSSNWFSDPATGLASTPYTLSRQDDVAIVPASASATITVDTNQRHQTILGVGGSLEESTVFNLSRMSATARERTLRALVDPGEGGFSVARITFGSSDFTGRDFYSYADGAADSSLAGFSIQKDIDYNIVATVKQALAINPDLKIFASVWSPPGWMKTSGALIGGSLLDEHIATLALYYRKAVQAYAAQGIPIHAVTLQNEPLFSPPDYPGMLVSADQERRLAKAMRTQFDTNNISTRIWAFDHNFAQGVDYAAGVLGEPGSPSDAYSSVDGIAFHDYDGDPSAMATVKSNYPDKDVLMTERAVFGVGGADRIAQYFRNQSTLYQGWVTMLDQNIAPEKWTGTPGATPLVQSTSNRDTVYYTPDYYLIAQYSKFVRPGAQRVGSNSGGAVSNVAFRNPDGTLVTVVINNSTSDQQFTLRVGGQQITSTLPFKTVGTYLWEGADSGSTGGGGGTGQIVSQANNKCLDVTDGSTANGNLPQMWTCYTGNTNQQWTLHSDGTVRSNGKCLDVKDNSTADGGIVQLWDCFAGPNQRWTAGNNELRNDGAKKCLDIKDNNRADGAKLQIWSCSGGSNQKWNLPS